MDNIWNYRLIVRETSGKEQYLASQNAHAAKSLAGYAIHSDAVRSVLVVDLFGMVIFYLVKDFNGHAIQDKTENVNSEDAHARFEVNRMLRDAGIPIQVTSASPIK